MLHILRVIQILKFVEYDKGYNAGYGNSLIIMDKDGKKYLLGHLSDGPSSTVLEKINNKRRPVTPVVKRTPVGPETGGSDGGPLSYGGGEVTYVVTQNIVQRQILPVPYFIKANNNRSSVTSNPEISPLLLT